MYNMKAIASLVFHIRMFPFNGKVVSLDQLSYYNPNASANPENVFPMVNEINKKPYVEIIPGVYKDFDLQRAYSGPPPIIPHPKKGLMCTMFTMKK